METLQEVVDVICAEYHGWAQEWKETCPYPPGYLKGVRIHFSNGISADVVIAEKQNSVFCYDGFEIAVLRNSEVVYDTPITDDVVNTTDLDGLYFTLQEIGDYANSI